MQIISTPRLTLRPFCEADREDTLAILMDGEVKKTYMIPDFESVEAAMPLLNRLRQLSLEDNRFVRAICKDNRVVGFLNDVEVRGEQVELGYVIATAHRGNGYAPEAVKAAIEELFNRGFAVVKAGAFEGNNASFRVMEKSGMHPTDETEYIQYRGENHLCRYYEIRK